jgi:hypothetical protein
MKRYGVSIEWNTMKVLYRANNIFIDMGKNKYIETPEKMWEHFEAYKNEVKSNPRKKHVFVGKDGVSDYELLERPLTLDGFECYCYDNGIISDLSQYFANTEQRYTDYQTICSRIRKAIKDDQIQGGMVGQYNASITQRLNGLTEKVQNEQNININKMPEWLKAPIENNEV